MGLRWHRTGLLALLGVLAFTARAQDSTAPLQPEIASGLTPQREVLARHAAVATAHPLASQAALEMLRAGGSAVDAAIAAQMVLGLVEPQSSGIGGGAFAVVLDPERRDAPLASYDGRETAPQAAREDLFLRQGQPLSFQDAVVGGRAVGTPGVLRMLALAHQRSTTATTALPIRSVMCCATPRWHASTAASRSKGWITSTVAKWRETSCARCARTPPTPVS